MQAATDQLGVRASGRAYWRGLRKPSTDISALAARWTDCEIRHSAVARSIESIRNNAGSRRSESADQRERGTLAAGQRAVGVARVGSRQLELRRR
jgi:hypothetical protein